MNLKLANRNPITGLIEAIEEFQHLTEDEAAAILERHRLFGYVDGVLRLATALENCGPGPTRDKLARNVRDETTQLAARTHNLAIANAALGANLEKGKSLRPLPDEALDAVARFDCATGPDAEPQLQILKGLLIALAKEFHNEATINLKARQSGAESAVLPLSPVPVITRMTSRPARAVGPPRRF